MVGAPPPLLPLCNVSKSMRGLLQLANGENLWKAVLDH